MTTNILKLRPTIKKAAKSIAYNWPGVIEADDAEQAITLRLLEHPDSIDKIVGMDRAAQYRAVVGIGHQIASKERANKTQFTGAYRYSHNEVRGALERGILANPPAKYSELMSDLKSAVQVLQKRTPQYVEAILDRYVSFNIPERGPKQVRLVRALDALVIEMNKVNKREFSERDDGPGTRRVLSNSTAQRIASKQYEGDYDPHGANWERSITSSDNRI